MIFSPKKSSRPPKFLSMFCEQLEPRFMLNGASAFCQAAVVESQQLKVDPSLVSTEVADDINPRAADSAVDRSSNVEGILFARGARGADDRFEQNDSRATAANLGTMDRPKTFGNLALLDAADWYKFKLLRKPLAAEKIVVGFQHADGNLNAVFYDATGKAIKSYTSGTNNETISLQGLSAGNYFLRVFGANGQKNAKYSLSFKLDDRYENNDSIAQAKSLGVIGEKRVFAGLGLYDKDDWYTFSLANPSVDGSKAKIFFDDAKGNLDAELYLNGVFLAKSDSNTDNEVILLNRPGLSIGTLTVQLRIFGQKNPSYRIVIENPFDDVYENNDTRPTAASISFTGQPFDGKATLTNLVLADSADWFYFASESVAVGRPASVVKIGFQHSQGDLDLYLYNQNGKLIKKSTGTGNSEQISLNGLKLHGPNGERLKFYIKVVGKNGALNNNYTLIVDTGFIRV